MLHQQLAAQRGLGSAADADRAACCLENVLPMVLGGQTLKDLLCLEVALQGNQEAKQEGLSVVRGALVRCKRAGKYCWFQVQAALRQQDGAWQLAVGQVDQRHLIKPEFVSSVPNNKSEAGAQAELAELATRWPNMRSSRRQVARIQWMVEGGTDQLSKILKREGIPPGTGSFPIPAPALESLMTTLRNPKGAVSRLPLVLPAAAVPPAAAARTRQNMAAPAPAHPAVVAGAAQPLQQQQQHAGLAAGPGGPANAAATGPAVVPPAQQPQQQPQQLHGAPMHTGPMASAALASQHGVTVARSQSAPLGPAAAAGFGSGPALPSVRPGLLPPPDPRIMRRNASMPVGPTVQPAASSPAAAAPAPYGGAPMAVAAAAAAGPEQPGRQAAAPLPAAAVSDVQARMMPFEPAPAQATAAAPAVQQQQQPSWAAAPAAAALQAAVGSGAPVQQPQQQRSSSGAGPPQQAPLGQAAALIASASALPLSQLHWAGAVGAETSGSVPPTSSAPLAGPKTSAEVAGSKAPLHGRPDIPAAAGAAGMAASGSSVHSLAAVPAGTAAALEAAAAPSMAPAALGAPAAPMAAPVPSLAPIRELHGRSTALAYAVPGSAATGPTTGSAQGAAAPSSAEAEADPLRLLAEIKRELAELLGSAGLDADGYPLPEGAAAAAVPASGAGQEGPEPATAAQPSSAGWGSAPRMSEAAAPAGPAPFLAPLPSSPRSGWAAATAGAQQGQQGQQQHSRQQQGGHKPEGSKMPEPLGSPAGLPAAGIKRSRWEAEPTEGASLPLSHAKQARSAELAEQGQRAGGAGAHNSTYAAEPAAGAEGQGERGSGTAALAGPSVSSRQSGGRTADRERTSSHSRSRRRSESKRPSSSKRQSSSHRRQSRSRSRQRSGSRNKRRSDSRHRQRSRSRGQHDRRGRSRSRSRSGGRSRGRRHRSRSSSGRKWSRSRSHSREPPEQLVLLDRLPSRVRLAIYNLCERSKGALPVDGFNDRVVERMQEVFRQSEGRMLDFLDRLSSELLPGRAPERPAAWIMYHLGFCKVTKEDVLGRLPQRAQPAIQDLCERSNGVLPVDAFNERILVRMQDIFGQNEGRMLEFLDLLRTLMPRHLERPPAWVMHHLNLQRSEPVGASNAASEFGTLPRNVQHAIEDLCERVGSNLPLSCFDNRMITSMHIKLRTEREMLRFLDVIADEVRPGLANPASFMMSLLSMHNV